MRTKMIKENTLHNSCEQLLSFSIDGLHTGFDVQEIRLAQGWLLFVRLAQDPRTNKTGVLELDIVTFTKQVMVYT
jgi:hypothetical protein